MSMQSAEPNKAKAQENAVPVSLLKRIGSTTFVVSVHFSQTSKDTLEDKILRLIEREAKDIA